MSEPHDVGFIGFITTTSELVRACVEQGILILPEKRDPHFGSWTWWQANQLMRGWSRGR